jgi:hypothetical protein
MGKWVNLVTAVSAFVALTVLYPVVPRGDYTAFRASWHVTETMAKDIV